MFNYSFSLFLLLCLAQLSHAEIYREIDKEGNVSFTDRNSTKADQLNLPPANIIKSTPQTSNDTDNRSSLKQVNDRTQYELNIISPVQNENIRSDIGNITLDWATQPPLDINENYTYSIFVDQQPLVQNLRSASYMLENINRGSHKIQITLEDEDGITVSKSTELTIHLHRFSIKHRAPK